MDKNVSESSVKLKAKIKAKKSQRTSSSTNKSGLDEISGETDILKMMEHVNKLLKTNPELVKQVSKCVSNVMNDKTLLDTITGKLQDQTFDNSEETEDSLASSNELTQ